MEWKTCKNCRTLLPIDFFDLTEECKSCAFFRIAAQSGTPIFAQMKPTRYDLLTDKVVANMIVQIARKKFRDVSIKGADIPTEFIKTKRLQIQIQREIKKNKS